MRFLIVVLALAAGCGKEIGDPCVISADCDPNGQRQCDPTAKEGYCTIMGCDYNTCPSEAECVRFFTGQFGNKACNPMTEDNGTDDCTFDEVCGLGGFCEPRSAEVRYCMRKCESQGDCRDGYECRSLDLMKQHGGEPVLAPGSPIDDSIPKFCAVAPAG